MRRKIEKDQTVKLNWWISDWLIEHPEYKPFFDSLLLVQNKRASEAHVEIGYCQILDDWYFDPINTEKPYFREMMKSAFTGVVIDRDMKDNIHLYPKYEEAPEIRFFNNSEQVARFHLGHTKFIGYSEDKAIEEDKLRINHNSLIAVEKRYNVYFLISVTEMVDRNTK